MRGSMPAIMSVATTRRPSAAGDGAPGAVEWYNCWLRCRSASIPPARRGDSLASPWPDGCAGPKTASEHSSPLLFHAPSSRRSVSSRSSSPPSRGASALARRSGWSALIAAACSWSGAFAASQSRSSSAPRPASHAGSSRTASPQQRHHSADSPSSSRTAA
ncbi:hypothetical protein STPH1_6282 [Streptomyces sp. OM5714]|nr:hypothetical protein STPH1_6282 [Streptomyces sp. OM5714]